jgi:glycosidase
LSIAVYLPTFPAANSLLMKHFQYIVCLIACISCSVQKQVNTSNGNKMQQNATPPEWINKTNVYEVNLRQYTVEGTFNAFAKHLPRLKQMGVHTLWFMPVTPISQKEKKGSMGSYYAASDYTAINPEFGTMADFKSLVSAAHAQGFKVILDWVANHTGWDHRWTTEHPEFYEKDSATNNFKRAHEMDDIIELDFANAAMRKAMIDAMRFWVTEADIDGFRCDLAFWVELDFWKEAKAALQPVKPLFWLAELDPLEHPDYMQVFDAAYTWTWMHKTRDWYQNQKPLDELNTVLQRYESAPGIKAWFTTNHDENSWNGTEYEKYGKAAKALAVFSCTWPGIPLLYGGQEAPNQKRLEFFEKDPIDWSGGYLLQNFYKTLLHLRAQHPALLPGSSVQRLHTSADTKVLAFLRQSGDRQVIVLLNLSNDNLNVTLNHERVNGQYNYVFSGAKKDFNNSPALELNAWEYIVLQR